MTREQTKKALPLLQAFAGGKTIQYKYDNGWRITCGNSYRNVWPDGKI